MTPSRGRALPRRAGVRMLSRYYAAEPSKEREAGAWLR